MRMLKNKHLTQALAALSLTAISLSSFGFMSVEHMAMGNALKLQFSPTDIESATTVKFTFPDTAKLTYGQIIAIAGDYYADVGHPYNPGPGYAISAPKTEQGREAEFLRAYATLENNPHKATTKRVTSHLASEFEAHLKSLTAAYPNAFKDVYAKDTSKWVKGYLFAAHGRNLIEPFRAANLDHFAPAAWKAYHAGHRVAIKNALKGHQLLLKGKKQLADNALGKAYTENAFACHYLTDAFSAGHMRTPRKALQDDFGKTGVILMGYMHDYDNEHGLKVHNAKGVSWTAYGDQHYFDPQDKMNRKMIHKVTQMSVDSLYQAFHTGKDVDSNETALHAWMPNYKALANYKKFGNTSPMFIAESNKQMAYFDYDGKYHMMKDHHDAVKVLFHRMHVQGRPM